MTGFAPNRTGFMDEPMRVLWGRMTPLPGDLRLYGGTALALYLDHRASTDFGFATPLPAVALELTRAISRLANAQLRGGPGMIDATLEIGRPIRITLMEAGTMIPHPEHPPTIAPNGVNVAHPADLVRAKLEACLTRDAPRDFVDVAHCATAWPELTTNAINSHVENSARTASGIGAALSDPPPFARSALSQSHRTTLSRMAKRITSRTTHRSRRRRDGWER